MPHALGSGPHRLLTGPHIHEALLAGLVDYEMGLMRKDLGLLDWGVVHLMHEASGLIHSMHIVYT